MMCRLYTILLSYARARARRVVHAPQLAVGGVRGARRSLLDAWSRGSAWRVRIVLPGWCGVGNGLATPDVRGRPAALEGAQLTVERSRGGGGERRHVLARVLRQPERVEARHD